MRKFLITCWRDLLRRVISKSKTIAARHLVLLLLRLSYSALNSDSASKFFILLIIGFITIKSTAFSFQNEPYNVYWENVLAQIRSPLYINRINILLKLDYVRSVTIHSIKAIAHKQFVGSFIKMTTAPSERAVNTNWIQGSRGKNCPTNNF